MRLTLRFLGLDLIDLCIETEPAAEECDEPGDCTTYPVGFVATYDRPDEVGLPDRYGDE